MTNPTRQEIIDSYEALDMLCEALDMLCEKAGEETYVKALRSIILSSLPPKPEPTMAEVKWDDNKHYLAEAEQVARGNVIMLEVVKTGQIRCMSKGLGALLFFLVSPDTLTPTGYRYALTEVQE